ncbi:MAG TPA: SagB family peptide dehydrogenase [Candidatus Angelobacter sp.]|nr:SagB family peptide dehydrogenase [Candidatus Angelobacter sp.]
MAIMRPSAATLRQQFSKMPIAPQVAKMRPRLVRELALLSTREELVVDGTSYLQVIRGKSARDVLPSVMALMDGTRTMPELEAAVPGVPAEQVRATVSLLFNCGMVENGVADSDPSANRQTLDFFRRHLGVTGANRTGKQAYERLQIAEVLILSSGENHERTLQSVLETTGVGRVVQIDPDSLRAWSPASGFTQSLLISFSLRQEDVQRHASLDDWCRERGLAWLRVSLDSAEDIADIGPLFSVAFSPCYRCFQAVHGRPATNAGDFSLPRAEIQFWVSMVAAEVVYLLSKIAPPITGPDFQRYRMKELQASRLPLPRVPGCEKCRPLPAGDSPMHIACVFEDCISVQSLTFAGPKNGAQKPAASTFETKRLPNCQLFPLVREMPKLDRGSLDVLHEQSVRANQPFTLRELSAILMLTGGLRESARGEDQIKRWSATAGNLGSVELYVLARNVDGLPPGLYFYQPREHALAAFRRRGGALKPTEFMQRLSGKTDDELPDALVLFTGAYHRIGRKYGAFGYKLVNLDAGVALSQMHLAASALGVYSQTAKLWVDALLEDQLNLDPGQEQSTAVAELYGTAAGTLAPANSLLASTPGGGHAPEKFRNQTVHEIVQTLYAESRRQSFDVRPVPELLVAQWQEGDVVPLPESARGGRLIADSFGRRYSTRSYGYEPVSLSQISTMLHCAHAEDSHAWYEEHAAGLPLDFVVLAWNVEGCEPGVYRYRPEMRALAWLAPAPSKQNAQELFLQPEFAAAPAVIWSFANLAASCARHGAFGHRLLLLRAGAACHRLWMAGLGMGLAGCLVAGVVPGAARRQFGVDGYRQTSLLAFAVGYGAQSAK